MVVDASIFGKAYVITPHAFVVWGLSVLLFFSFSFFCLLHFVFDYIKLTFSFIKQWYSIFVLETTGEHFF